MTTHLAFNRTKAFTLIELLVVIAAIALLAVTWLSALHSAEGKAMRVMCLSNLKEVGVGCRVWEGEHGDKYPAQMVLTNSEAMLLITNGNTFIFWQMMSNQLVTPKVLHCPADLKRVAATNFAVGFGDANISYFFNLDAVETSPQMILDGDDNLTVNGMAVKPGVLTVAGGDSMGWTDGRHRRVGNVGLSDGSVQQVTIAGLNAAAAAATNGAAATFRLVVP